VLMSRLLAQSSGIFTNCPMKNQSKLLLIC
jgi:hypothetical protein